MSSPITSTATTLPAQMLEVAQSLSNAEKAIAEDVRPNNITIGYDDEGSEVTITVTLPVTATVSGDSVTFAATDYLEV